MSRNKIRGEQIKDESVDSADLASGSIRAGEVDEQIITGHPVASAGTVDVTNDRLLIWDANGSSTGTLKQVAPSSLGITASPGGSDTQVQYNNGGALAGGTKLLYDEANGRLKIGDTDAPQNALEVYTDSNNDFAAIIDNDANQNGHGLKVTSDGTGTGTNILDLESASTTFFRARGDGRVGIGKISSLPDAVLTVSSSNTDSDIAIAHKIHHIGDSDTYMDFPSNDNISFTAGGNTQLEISDSAIHVSQYIRHMGDTNTHINFTDDKIVLKAGNIAMVTMEEKASAPHEVTINDGGNNIDFVVEDNSGTTLLMTDADTSRVGIGTESPSSELTINGTEPKITLRESDADRAEIGINDSDNLVITNQSTNKFIVFKSNDAGVVREGLRLGGTVPEVVVNEGSDSLVDFRVESDNQTHMLFVDGGNDRVGVGTSVPQSTLHVHADAINDGTVTISQSDNSGDASQLDISKSRGSGASPAAVQDSDFIGQVRMLGYDGDSYDNFADIYAQASGAISTTSHPTKVVIRTTQANATSPTVAVTIDENQGMTVVGSIYGKMRHMTHHRYNDGGGSGKEYIPWSGTSEQASPNYISQGVAPYAGRLVKVLVRSSTGMGLTTVGIHINTDGNAVINSTAEETKSFSMVANTSAPFNFTNTNHFAAGDIIGVSIDPSTAHGNVNVTCVWEYDITA